MDKVLPSGAMHHLPEGQKPLSAREFERAEVDQTFIKPLRLVSFAPQRLDK
jgi:hypothetical protein